MKYISPDCVILSALFDESLLAVSFDPVDGTEIWHDDDEVIFG